MATNPTTPRAALSTVGSASAGLTLDTRSATFLSGIATTSNLALYCGSDTSLTPDGV